MPLGTSLTPWRRARPLPAASWPRIGAWMMLALLAEQVRQSHKRKKLKIVLVPPKGKKNP